MDTLNKDDFINVYVLNTLNEIKTSVKENIKLDKNREDITDKKMLAVLTDLINANFKNLQKDPNGNIIYTLLPIVDEKENKKVRTSLALYYTALYYDNVELLQDLMRANINFNGDYGKINLSYLDKSISSEFARKEYIDLLKECDFVFNFFHKSIEGILPPKREEYILRFKKILEIKHEVIAKIYKSDQYSSIKGVFSKKHLDAFSDETYLLASAEQLLMIGSFNDEGISNANKDRLNNLMQTQGFSNCIYNYDLMLTIFPDEKMSYIDYYMSKAIAAHYETTESLPKILDFINRRPDLAFEVSLIPKEKFKEIDNDTLIEICDYSDKHLLSSYLRGSEECDRLAKKVKPTVAIKRVLGRYKRTSKQ